MNSTITLQRVRCEPVRRIQEQVSRTLTAEAEREIAEAKRRAAEPTAATTGPAERTFLYSHD